MSLTQVSSATNYAFGRLTSYSFGSLSIGAADADRWIVAVVSYSDSFNNGQINSCTIDGNAMTRVTRTVNEPEGVAIYIKKVTTGTTGTFAITEAAGHRSRGIVVYRLISTETDPTLASAQAENATAASLTSVPSGSAIIAVQASTAYATAPSISGEAANDVAVNIDGSDYIRAYSTDNSTSSTQSITSGSGASNHAIASFSFGAGGGTTLAADPGSFTFTGTDAGLLHNRVLSADPGSLTFVGVDATFSKASALVADAGAFTFTGTDAALLHNRVLVADPGSLTFTGTAADLVYTPTVAFTLNADPGVFSFTGTDAQLLKAHVLSVDPGTLTFTGTNANLQYSGDAGAEVYFDFLTFITDQDVIAQAAVVDLVIAQAAVADTSDAWTIVLNNEYVTTTVIEDSVDFLVSLAA